MKSPLSDGRKFFLILIKKHKNVERIITELRLQRVHFPSSCYLIFSARFSLWNVHIVYKIHTFTAKVRSGMGPSPT